MAGQRILVIDDSATILKVVQIVLTKADYEVTTATDGEVGIALARENPPDLILVDFVMPRMNGYQVCRALADEPGLKDIPVVLMSAKGDQVGERFVKVLGIVDYITKPFSPEAILAVVTHILQKRERGDVGNASLLPMSEQEAQALAEHVQGAQQPGSTPAASPRTREIAERLVARIAEAVRNPPANLAEHTGEVSLLEQNTQIEDAVRSALEPAQLQDLLTSMGAVEADPDVLAGDLRVIPMAEVLHLLKLQEQTGKLQVTRAGTDETASIEVFFRQGRVDLAAAAGVSDEFLLGRFIVEENLMTRQDLDLFLQSRSASATKLFGAQLCKLGYVTDAELKQALSRQTQELVYELLRWKHGRFRFIAIAELPAVALDAALGLDVDGILMEGFRRVDEWHLIEREVDNFDAVFLRNEEAMSRLGTGQLTRDELSILELVNGKNTIRDIIRQSRMGSFDVMKMMYRLLSIKLVRKRVMPVAV